MIWKLLKAKGVVPPLVYLSFLLYPLALVIHALGMPKLFDEMAVLKVLGLLIVGVYVFIVGGYHFPRTFSDVDTELADRRETTKEGKVVYCVKGGKFMRRLKTHSNYQLAILELVLLAAIGAIFYFDWSPTPAQARPDYTPVVEHVMTKQPGSPTVRPDSSSASRSQHSAASTAAQHGQKPEQKGWFTGWNPFGNLFGSHSSDMVCMPGLYNPACKKQEPGPSGSSEQPPSPPPESPVQRRWEIRGTWGDPNSSATRGEAGDSSPAPERGAQRRSAPSDSRAQAQANAYQKVRCPHMGEVDFQGRRYTGPRPIECVQYAHLDGSAQLLPLYNSGNEQTVIGIMMPLGTCVELVYSELPLAPQELMCNTGSHTPARLLPAHVYAIRIPVVRFPNGQTYAYPILDHLIVTVCPRRGSDMGEAVDIAGYCGPEIPRYPSYVPEN